MNRVGFIGGSDIAAIIGISPFGTAYDVWLEKTGKPVDKDRTYAQENALRWGKRLEPVIIDALAEERGIVATARNQVYRDPIEDWMRAEIDFEYVDADGTPCNGDSKTVNAFARKDWGEEGTDEIPEYYVCQFLWGQGVNGRTRTGVAALIGGSQLRFHVVERDQEVIDFLRQEASSFWTRNVIADVPPSPQSREDAQRIIAKLPGFRWTPTDEVITDIRELARLKAEAKALEALQEKAEKRILCAFAGQAILNPSQEQGFIMTDSSGRQLASWNRQSTTRIDTGLIKSMHPEVAEVCSKTTSHHVLRIAKEK